MTESMRIGWPTVGGIIERIQVEIDGQVDRLAGLERIEIDATSYKRQTWNGAELARSLAVSEPTIRRYLDALSDALVFRQLQPWHTNVGKRQVRSPKVHVRDSGLLHRRRGRDTQ
nr:DUF4143 domain-containing protein [Candidatus Microthrix sp.]